MLYFISKAGTEREWHVGQKIPAIVSDVVEVQADGDELKFILDNFYNIPALRPEAAPVQLWKGEFARFIYDNMPGSRGS